MSQKWVRSKQWDDRFFPAWAWPAKAVLRAFSSVTLGVTLLVLVACYGVLASVPIGLLAQVPTVVFYAATAGVCVAAVGVGPGLFLWGRLGRAGVGRAPRFAAAFLTTIGLSVLALLAWSAVVYPAIRFDPVTGTGVRFFASFCEAYKSTTLRRLPGFEMSELEFYGWWPLKLMLFLFVANMVTATVRRIEFVFVNLGVLTVHTGIVTMAIGSIYYTRLKEEGDVLLVAGEPDEQGTPRPGRTEFGFYDNTDVALWLNQGRGWDQRPLSGIPRYNDYSLGVVEAEALGEEPGAHERRLSRRVSERAPGTDRTDPDISYEIVGYASYATLESTWLPGPAPAGGEANPLRFVDLWSSGAGGAATADGQEGAARPMGRFHFLPRRPNQRIASLGGMVVIEYALNMEERRWADLTQSLPSDARHALIVEVPGAGARAVLAVSKDQRLNVPGTAWTIRVKDISPEPPFPIITPGYEGASSSVAVVRVDGPNGVSFERWLYSRFPELSQDLSPETTESGMPKRGAPDPAIRIAYLDASTPHVVFDERADGTVRAAVRLPGREATIIEDAGEQLVSVGPAAGLRLGAKWEHAVSVESPTPVSEVEREREAIGTHLKAAVAVRVTMGATGKRDAGKGVEGGGWSETLWVPFSQYLGIGPDLERVVDLPDGRRVAIAFGRRWRELPGFSLRLMDFEMTPYPHSDQPKDFRSELLISGEWDPENPERIEAHTSLNDPLLVTVPFVWSDKRPMFVNVVGSLVSRIAPIQYKFSQAGWDSAGWTRTKRMAEAGELPRPVAAFTILGVGNNPGIYIIAAGAVLFSLGVPWAFYVKPAILRYRKRRVQAKIATGEIKPRAAGRGNGDGGGGGGGGGGTGGTPGPGSTGASPARASDQAAVGATP